LLRFHEATGDDYPVDVAPKWFKERFGAGTTKNVNTMSPLLTAAYLHEVKKAKYLPHLESSTTTISSCGTTSL